jgi:hypothetical protein
LGFDQEKGIEIAGGDVSKHHVCTVDHTR